VRDQFFSLFFSHLTNSQVLPNTKTARREMKEKKKKREKEREEETTTTTTKKKKRKNNIDDDDDDSEKKKKKKKKEKKEKVKEDDGAKGTTLPKKLNDIDAEIERLSRLAEAAPEESGDEEDDLGMSSSGSSSSSSLGRIAPLPPEAYPEHYGYGSKRGNEGAFKGKRVSSSSTSAAASKNVLIPGLAEREKNRPKCETCNLSFTSQAQLEEHLKGKGHRRKAAGGATQRQQQQQQHQHQRREAKPPEGPHCKLCRKMFTSLAQKEEHEGGKWHRMRVEGKLAPSNKPYA